MGSDEKSAAKAEKKARKAKERKEGVAADSEFKDFDKVVVAELEYDEDEVKNSKFVMPFDAAKTSLTREEWDAAIGEVNSAFHYTGPMALLCCLCGAPEHHVGDVKKKCKELTETYESRGVAFHVKHKEDYEGHCIGCLTMGMSLNDDEIYLIVTQKDSETKDSEK